MAHSVTNFSERIPSLHLDKCEPGEGISQLPQRKPRILYLAVGVFDKGGISRFGRYQIQALRELTGESNVCVLSFFAPGNNDFEQPFRVDYHGSGPRRSSEVPFLTAALRYGRAFKPDIIWCSHVHLMPHALVQRRIIHSPSIVLNVYGRELWGPKNWFRRLVLPRADAIVSDSHFSADYITSKYGIDRNALSVHWNCVDVERFKPKPRNFDLMKHFNIPVGEDLRYVMTLGRIEKRSQYKGYERLLDAINAIRDEKVLGLFVGDGDDRVRLEQKARDLGLGRDRVCFLGSVPEGSLPDVYNICDVFSLVSEFGYDKGEGVPFAALEAAACGKPIIVSSEDGSGEAVVSGLTGWALSSCDSDGLTRRLSELLQNEELRQTMGNEGRTRIETGFTYDTFRAKTGKVLAQLEANRNRARLGYEPKEHSP